MKHPATYWQRQVRLCADCGHAHGGRGYGLCCTMLSKDEVCPCVTARPVAQAVTYSVQEARPVARSRHPRPRVPGAPAARTLSRRAAREFAALSPEQRAIYEHAARRLDETDFTLEEYAAEVGLDRRLLWRMRKALGMQPQPRVMVAA